MHRGGCRVFTQNMPGVTSGSLWKRAMNVVLTLDFPSNSASGVLSYEPFYPVFSAMEQCGMVLNLHGECPSGEDITILNAESR